MVSREEVDAIRTIGLDPVDLLVIPRVLALLVTLPLLTFIAMIAGLLGGMSVGAFSLDIPPQAYYARMQIGRAHVWTPVTNAHLVCRLLLEQKKQKPHEQLISINKHNRNI